MSARPTRADVSRRRFLAVVVAVAGAAVVACDKAHGASPAVCTDSRGLAPADAQARTALHYIDHAPEPGKSCSDCQQFEPAASEGPCDRCKLLRGPISPEGYCNGFAAKA